MQKVLITGASGFLGKYTVNALLDKGYDVVALQHNSKLKADPDIMIIQADICDEHLSDIVLYKIEECDSLIHLAADINIVGTGKTLMTNCMGTYHLTQLAKKLQAKCFLYLSSIPVIGIPVELPVTEVHMVNPKTLYHITKYTGEMIVSNECGKDMNTLIYRIPSPVGVGMSPDNFLSFLLKKCIQNEKIELYGQGMRIQNYIDVRDIANAILCGLASGRSGLYLIAGDEGISNRELAFLCARVTGSSSQIIWGKRPDPEEENRWVISNEKARSELGFLPRYALSDTVEWIYKENRGM